MEKFDRGMCWPKFAVKKPNSEFKAIIYEEGHEGPYTLSLYAVNEVIDAHWHGWLNSRKYRGVPLPPDNKRLDSVELIKGDYVDGNKQKLHDLINRYRNIEIAKEINNTLIEIEKTKPEKLLEIFDQLKAMVEADNQKRA